jgi:hypothetical protein
MHAEKSTMSAVHLHLLLSHVPVLGAVFGLLLLAYGTLRGKDQVVRVSLGTLAIVGLAGLAVYLTGEPAEGIVEELPGISEAILERHEEAALFATIGGGVVALVALAGLVLHRARPVGPRFAAATLVMTLGLVGGMAWTANLGGQIRHSEIRAGASAEAGHEDDDD